MEPPELLKVAREAALAAAPLLLERFGSEPVLTTKSSPTDLVSEADLAAERAIREVLAERVPNDAIVGEEGDDVTGTSGRRWLIDPIDGTTNYLYGNPHWCISVACDGLAGVVFDPVRGELFAAHAGGPATIDGEPIDVLRADVLGRALLATGFGYTEPARAQQAKIVARILPEVRDIRRAGSAALDLAWTAAGRLDAYFEHGVQDWDVSAGALICSCAGLDVEPLEPRDGLGQGILVGPSSLVRQIRSFVA
jgi:myo-inositol-1(or 4)-monophosphatase